MKRLLHFPVLLVLVLATACDRSPTGTRAPDGASFTHEPKSVTINAPDAVYSATDVTATVTVDPPQSWHYTWYYRWCYDGSAPGDCDYQWHYITAGQDVMSVTKRVYDKDWWVDFRVEVRDIYGHVVGSDDHRVLGPRNFSDGGCTDVC